MTTQSLRHRYPEPVLHQPFEKLGFSQAFCTAATQAAFTNLAQLLALPTARLMLLPGFTLHHVYEYVGFVESQNLGHYVDPY
ncbi:MAG: hypothetical protein EOP04_25610 [Proteobacteria bacterium]|nr:MAG: hypothetical protein EOP04_25610 [Pseudomonadota bacterium]